MMWGAKAQYIRLLTKEAIMVKRMLVFDFKASEKSFFESKTFADYDISFFEGSLNSTTLKNVSLDDKANAEIISVFLTSRINGEVIEAFKSLKIIATRTTGCNHINLEECLENDIAVANVTEYGERTVVQYTFGLIIALTRKIIPALFDMKCLQNNPENYVGRDLNALTIGVIGTGLIGSKICKVANYADMKVLAYDINPNPDLVEKYNVEYADFEYLIKNSDVITLHLPYNDENYHLFAKREFEQMKSKAYLINTSRGELVDTHALYKALIDKKIQGCALDVSECEEFVFDMDNFMQKMAETSHNCLSRALIIQKMLELPNVIITPHIAYKTEEAILDILETTMQNIEAFYKGKKINRVV